MESSLNIQKIVKSSFAVIGIEGSTDDGEGFIPMLWSDANAHFDEVSPVASRDENGALLGIWGAMSDETRSFLPWTDGFSRGLYLAGVECPIDADVPDGWTKWVVPGYEYLARESPRGHVQPYGRLLPRKRREARRRGAGIHRPENAAGVSVLSDSGIMTA